MKKFLSFLAASLCIGIIIAGSGQSDEPKPNKSASFMRLKLDHSQKVLEGLANEDFESIAKNAQQISLLTEDEMWQVLQTPEYRHLSAEFQRIANDLTKQAKKKNLEGSTLSYVQLTMSCVNCHKYVRAAKSQ